MKKRYIPRHEHRGDYLEHIEALATLSNGQPVHFVRCTDCVNWTGKCEIGRPATWPEYRVHLCGEFLSTEDSENE